MKTQKGNALIVIIVIIAIIVLAFLIFGKGSSTPAPVAENNTPNTQIPVTPPVNNTMGGTASVDQDLSTLDSNLSGLTKDQASIDASLNDKATVIPQ